MPVCCTNFRRALCFCGLCKTILASPPAAWWEPPGNHQIYTMACGKLFNCVQWLVVDERCSWVIFIFPPTFAVVKMTVCFLLGNAFDAAIKMLVFLPWDVQSLAVVSHIRCLPDIFQQFFDVFLFSSFLCLFQQPIKHCVSFLLHFLKQLICVANPLVCCSPLLEHHTSLVSLFPAIWFLKVFTDFWLVVWDGSVL